MMSRFEAYFGRGLCVAITETDLYPEFSLDICLSFAVTELRHTLFSLDRLAVMVSRKRSLPLLQLAGLNPVYISADVDSGEKECLAMFPVGYADDYEEPESVQEEEVEVLCLLS